MKPSMGVDVYKRVDLYETIDVYAGRLYRNQSIFKSIVIYALIFLQVHFREELS